MEQVPFRHKPEEVAYLKNSILLLCSCLVLVLPLPARPAELKLEVITLNYRNVEELIPVIKPFVGMDGTVTGMNNQLIIKATPEDLAAVRQLLLNIDRRPRRLMITVTHDISETAAGSHQSITGRYSTGNVDIAGGAAPHRGNGGSITVHDGNAGRIRYRLDNSHSTMTNNSDLRIQALEGQPAFIESGSQVPLSNRTAYRTQDGVIVQDTIEYHDATTGFYVIPNLNGDVVTVLISPFMTRINPDHRGTFNVQNIETTVQGRLGEWIEIGGQHQESRREQSGLLSEHQRQQDQAHASYIKVEELP